MTVSDPGQLTAVLRLCLCKRERVSYSPVGVWLNLSQDLMGTMSQPKDPQTKSNVDGGDHVAVALQQYNDTKGHFSLVRWVTALGFPFIPHTDSGPEIFD
jgi:hypothetical protein